MLVAVFSSLIGGATAPVGGTSAASATPAQLALPARASGSSPDALPSFEARACADAESGFATCPAIPPVGLPTGVTSTPASKPAYADSRSLPYGAQVKMDKPVLWYTLDNRRGSGSAINYGSLSTDQANPFNAVASHVQFCHSSPDRCPKPGAVLATGSAYFNGTDSRLTTPAPGYYNFAQVPVSAEAWFESPPSFTGTGYVATILGSVSGFGIDRGKPFLSVAETRGTQVIASSLKANNGAWHYLAVTYSPTSATGGTIAFYLDGRLVATKPTKYGLPVFDDQPGAIGYDTIGSRSYYFRGQIEDVAAYTGALTPARIAAHFAARRSAGPVLLVLSSRLCELSINRCRENASAAGVMVVVS